MAKRKRNIQILFCVSPEEKKLIRRKMIESKTKNMGAYLRKMAISYKKLWKLLIDKDMMKKDLRAMTGVSTTTMSRLSKDENVSTDIVSKICSALNCDVGDIMEFVPDKKEEQ